MPFIRATSFVDPTDHVTPGYWFQLSTDPVGTWKGFPQSSWPAQAGNETTSTYATKLTNLYASLTISTFGALSINIVFINFGVLTSLTPLVLGDVTVSEGDCKIVKIIK
jgi:hypothetical protein